jgi:hypothetical protein
VMMVSMDWDLEVPLTLVVRDRAVASGLFRGMFRNMETMIFVVYRFGV